MGQIRDAARTRMKIMEAGVKGVGMLGSAGVQAAIANAVHDAAGKRFRRLPIRIEDIVDYAGALSRPLA